MIHSTVLVPRKLEMKQTYEVTISNLRLGEHAELYKLIFYIGGFDGLQPPISQKLINSPQDMTFRVEVKFPKKHPKLIPADAALVVIAMERINTPDDKHKRKMGCQESGSAIFPLKGLKESTKPLVFYPAQHIYPAIDFTKMNLRVKALTPLADSMFDLPNIFSVDHNKTLDDKLLLKAVLVGQQLYSKKTEPVYQDIGDMAGMPPWRFDKNFELPGYMLSCNVNPEPHSAEWWKKLIGMGVQRVYPFVKTKDTHDYVCEQVNDPRAIVAVGVAACSIPPNYWRYTSDESEVKKKKYGCENYTPLSRVKLGKITVTERNGTKKEVYITPGDDCENMGGDIGILAQELQTLQVDAKQYPAVHKIQSAMKDWIVLQSLTGVHGAKEQDGESTQGEAPIGLHSMTDLMSKQHFLEAHQRVNKSQNPFDGWLIGSKPGEKLDKTLHGPVNAEGTGTIDPLGDDYRNAALRAYSTLLKKQGSDVLRDMKIVMPTTKQNISQTELFYVSKVSFVSLDLIKQGYDSCLFTPVTIEGNNVRRMITHEDFMNCSEKVGLRVEPPVTLEQASMIKHLHSFYPPITSYEEPEELEKSPVRQSFRTLMSSISSTMKTLNRSPPKGTNKYIADFYPAYYQLSERNVSAICNFIKSTPEIVDVEVEEQDVAKYLGGYRIAFSVALPPSQK
jgi:hypothetical protein